MSTIYRNHGYEIFFNSNHDMISSANRFARFSSSKCVPLPGNPFISRLPSLSRIVYIVSFPSCQVSLVQRLGYEGPHFFLGGRKRGRIFYSGGCTGGRTEGGIFTKLVKGLRRHSQGVAWILFLVNEKTAPQINARLSLDEIIPIFTYPLS